MKYLLLLAVFAISCKSNALDLTNDINVTTNEVSLMLKNKSDKEFAPVELTINKNFTYTVPQLAANEVKLVLLSDFANKEGDRFLLKKINEIKLYAETRDGGFGSFSLTPR